MVKKYKLIKEYPGSPKLGTEINYSEKWLHYNFNGGDLSTSIAKEKVEDYPEYWEQLVKKDYEILSFVNNGSIGGVKGFIIPLQEDGFYYKEGYSKTPNWPEDNSLEFLLEAKYADIYSVKRLSDGEVFTVGDRVTYYGKNTEIKSIYYNEHDQLSFKVKGDSAPLTGCFGVEMNHLKKRVGLCVPVGTKFTYNSEPKVYTITSIEFNMVNFTWGSGQDGYMGIETFNKHFNNGHYKLYIESKVLFTTEDGVNIHENDTVYQVHKDYKIFRYTEWKRFFGDGGKPLPRALMFSTQKAAENYVKCNKPVLSYKDVLGLFDEWYISSFKCRDSFKDDLSDFVKRKI